jgi:hypothetical protein
MRWLGLLVVVGCVLANADCSSGSKGIGAGGSNGGGGSLPMPGDPIGDSGVCFGDVTDPCAVCRCTYCGPVTAACVTNADCFNTESAFKGCAQRAQDATELTQCRDQANAASPKAGPYLDCLIVACSDKCL